MTERKVSGTIVDAQTAQAQTSAALLEIEQNSGSAHNFQYQTVTIERNGEMVEIEVPFDDINLLDDFEDEDLTEEGERSLGIIFSDHDTTSGNQAVKSERERLPLGTIQLNSISDYTITCPFTGSTEVYQVSTGVFASYKTDQPFRVEFNLADLNPDQS
jgi:hypothetical protein